MNEDARSIADRVEFIIGSRNITPEEFKNLKIPAQCYEEVMLMLSSKFENVGRDNQRWEIQVPEGVRFLSNLFCGQFLKGCFRIELPSTLEGFGVKDDLGLTLNFNRLEELILPDKCTYLCPSFSFPRLVHFRGLGLREDISTSFRGGSFLERVELGNNLRHAPVLSRTKNLKSFEIPSNWSVLPMQFMYKSGIERIVLPSNIKQVLSGAFEDSQLREVTLEEGVGFIGQSAFADTHLREVSLPRSLQYIGDRAFKVPSLRKVKISRGTEIEGEAFPRGVELEYY